MLPFAPDAWIDEKKSKVGYEIAFFSVKGYDRARGLMTPMQTFLSVRIKKDFWENRNRFSSESRAEIPVFMNLDRGYPVGMNKRNGS